MSPRNLDQVTQIIRHGWLALHDPYAHAEIDRHTGRWYFKIHGESLWLDRDTVKRIKDGGHFYYDEPTRKYRFASDEDPRDFRDGKLRSTTQWVPAAPPHLYPQRRNQPMDIVELPVPNDEPLCLEMAKVIDQLWYFAKGEGFGYECKHYFNDGQGFQGFQRIHEFVGHKCGEKVLTELARIHGIYKPSIVDEADAALLRIAVRGY